MKTTEKNIEKTAGKFGRCILAALLISLTCLSPVTYRAYAEEDNAASASEEVATIDSTDATSDQSTSAASAANEAIAAPDVDSTATNETSTNDSSEIVTAADEATGEEATTEDSHTFNVGTTLELMDVYKYDINSNSNESFVINLTDDITLVRPTERVDTHGNRVYVGKDRLNVKNGNTVTILGHGHTIRYTDKSTTNLSLGSIDANLILGSADGSDSLTITLDGTSQIDPLVSVVQGGTCVINEGVTLSNNVNATGLAGGAVCIQSHGVLTMNGGVIEGSSNSLIPYGGAVAVDGGEFHMNGGTIKGNSEPDMAQGYEGAGGAVAVGLHGDVSTFTMSGNAVIEGNTAKNGGGVYVGPNATLTMSDTAAIVNNTATEYGGGVYVEQGGTFTMGEGNTIKGNNAQYGGGILNFGTATVTNIYDNDASTAGADIYNDGTITMEDVKDEWSLAKAQSTSDPNYVPSDEASTPVDDTKPDLAPITIASAAQDFFTVPQAYADTPTTGATTSAMSSNIDGWYYDGHRETGETDTDGNAVVEHNRWNANESTENVPQYLQSYAVTGQPTTETMGLKAAHSKAVEPATHDISVIWENEDGTVLYTMDHVDPADVPDADEYNELSGNENPTEPDENNVHYDFDGWNQTSDDAGDVIYIADYKTVPDSDNPDTPVVPDNPDSPDIPDTPSNPEIPAYPLDQPATHEDSDEPVASTPDDEAPGNEGETATVVRSDSGTAPRMGDDFLPLVLASTTAMGLALLGLEYTRRTQQER